MTLVENILLGIMLVFIFLLGRFCLEGEESKRMKSIKYTLLTIVLIFCVAGFWKGI